MSSAQAFFDHWTACPNCYPRHDRYCHTGRQLWLDDKVEWVLSHDSIARRRAELADMHRNTPAWVGEIERRVVERFNSRKAA